MSKSRVVSKQQCPKCKDSGADNLAVYEDGSTYCFSCNTYDKSDTLEPDTKPDVSCATYSDLIPGTVNSLTSRGINDSTCRFFNYQVGKYTGSFGKNDFRKDEWVQIANYCDIQGRVVAQKIRTSDKKMKWLGDVSSIGLYGQWLYNPNPNLFVTVTEGEIDALSVGQACGLQFPVVSVPSGAGGARKALEGQMKWLQGFKYVILGLDSDEAGIEATEACMELFDYGKVRIAKWSGKDANEMLQAGKTDKIKDTLFRATAIEPKNIVTVSDIMPRILHRPTTGSPYPWPTMTDITYGMRPGEILILVGANGIGKTEIVKDIIFSQIESGRNVGLFSFEQSPESTIQRLVGSKLGLKLHIPGERWEEEDIHREALLLDQKIFLYDHTHSVEMSELRGYIRYLAKVKNVGMIVVDNLKGLRKGHSEAKGYLQDCMLEFQAISRELGVTFVLLSHVAKDKFNYSAYVSTSPKRAVEYAEQTAEDIQKMIKRPGMEWESGRMPSKENVEGESAVCDLADFVFAIARNTTSEDPEERMTTKVKCLKARLDGSKTGKTFDLVYTNNGRLIEKGQFNNSVF